MRTASIDPRRLGRIGHAGRWGIRHNNKHGLAKLRAGAACLDWGEIRACGRAQLEVWYLGRWLFR